MACRHDVSPIKRAVAIKGFGVRCSVCGVAVFIPHPISGGLLSGLSAFWLLPLVILFFVVPQPLFLAIGLGVTLICVYGVEAACGEVVEYDHESLVARHNKPLLVFLSIICVTAALTYVLGI